MEVIISFNRTSTMAPCIHEVREGVEKVIDRLLEGNPKLRIGLVIFGHYTDVMFIRMFTSDADSLYDDLEERACLSEATVADYQDGLQAVREITWTDGMQHALIMIGDTEPNPEEEIIDWREEADKLFGELGVRIYAVQCQDNGEKATEFYQSIAKRTQGRYLRLSELSTVVSMIQAQDKSTSKGKGAVKKAKGTAKKPKSAAKKPKGAKAKNTQGPKLGSVKKSVKRLSPAERKSLKADPVRQRARKNRIVKIDRDKTQASKFILKKLAWSTWRVAMCPKRSTSCPRHWLVNNGFPGEHRRHLFRDTDVRAVYEFAIQQKKGGKRYVMYTTCSQGFPQSTTWFRKFIARKPLVLAEIQQLMNSSGILSMRRAVLPRSCTVKLENGIKTKLKEPMDYTKLLNKLYNYTWQVQAKRHRRPQQTAPSSAP